MTAFVCGAVLSVALTEIPPIWGVVFATCAAMLSKLPFTKYFSVFTLPLLLTLCFLNLPTEAFLLCLVGCVLTSCIKKNVLYSLPVLLILSFVFACLDMSHGNNTDYTVFFLIPLAFCVASLKPKSASKALSVTIFLILPVLFGGGKITTACILLPPLTPVLLCRVKSIYCNKKKAGEVCK